EEVIVPPPLVDRLRLALMLFHKQLGDRLSIRRQKQCADRAVETGEENSGIHLFILLHKSRAKVGQTVQFARRSRKASLKKAGQTGQFALLLPQAVPKVNQRVSPPRAPAFGDLQDALRRSLAQGFAQSQV